MTTVCSFMYIFTCIESSYSLSLFRVDLLATAVDSPSYLAHSFENVLFSICFIAKTVPSKMGVFQKVFMSAAGLHEENEEHHAVRKEHLYSEDVKRSVNTEGRYSGIPAIPTDIGYDSGKGTSGKRKSGVVSQVTSNPGVVLGMGLTTLALLGMFKSSFVGDKLGAQKFMRYRIMAQFFTVTALVAGVTIFGATYEDEDIENKITSPVVLQKQ
ncbi:HIG1 domain-containing protein [Trichostrongylus colubriformis]|uniref:HIG1 domain-containing protein n=1 Tax=Trichostrongylus colubriformis TaxID=6319 RepID=A0AAN8ID62_TRICO